MSANHLVLPIRTIAIGSILLNLAIVAGFVLRRSSNTNAQLVENLTFQSKLNASRTELFNSFHVDSTDIVFVGDSHSAGFLLDESFPGKKVRNRGIPGNEIEMTIQSIQKMISEKPSKIFLQIGVNDLIAGKSPDYIINKYSGLIHQIKDAGIALYVQSLFPTTGKYENIETAVEKTNNLLKDLCYKNNIRYIDVYSGLVKAGKLDNELTYDGLHLNSHGYDIWKNAVEPNLN